MDIDLIAIRALTSAFNEFVAACVDEHGKPRAPSRGALAKARGCLPPGSTMSYGYKGRREAEDRARAAGPGLPTIVFPETDPNAPRHAGMYYDFGDGLHRLDRSETGELTVTRLDPPSPPR